MHFCGNPEQFGEGAVTYRLPTNRPTFCLRATLPGIGSAALLAACMDAFARWTEVCDVTFTETQDQNAAQFLIVDHAFDGPSGILADCMLPSPGLRQQRMRLDRNENWVIATNPPQNRIELRAVLCHEMGHGIGMMHLPVGPPPDLMEPSYRPTIIGPQATEAAMMAKLYGPPKTTPIDPNAPPGESLGVEIIIRQAQATYKATGTAKRIA